MTEPPAQQASRLSPCNAICRIDPLTQLCMGCGRTMDEIGRWSKLSDEQRRQVMGLLPSRMRKLVRQREAAGLDGRQGDQ
ncbi:MAG: DUF1289 domain-containing protein [Cohaesibacteraceae bacterium]